MGLVSQFAFYSVTAFIMDISERNHYRLFIDKIESKIESKLESI